MGKKIEVELVGRDRNYASTLRGAEGATRRLSTSFLKAAAVTGAVVAGFEAVKGAVHAGIEEYSQHAQVAAQTEAVLKSTGAAAGITAQHVDELANSILRKTGIDDEAVIASENLVLGFTHIRNAAGAGNDVFDRTIKLVQDYTVRTGKSATQASIAFGKALNDPVKGMGALGRAGIILTDAQKDVIKGMEESGHHMDAQKYLLGLLEERYKGAAEAAGKTLPGQLNILKETFNDLAGEIVAKAVPTVQAFVTWLMENLPQIEATFKTVFDAIRTEIQDWANILGPLIIPTITLIRDTIQGIADGGIQGGIDALTKGFSDMSVEAKIAAVAIGAIAIALTAALVAANPIAATIIVLAGLAEGFKLAYQHSQEFRNIVNTAVRDVQATISAMVAAARVFWQEFGGVITAAANVVKTQAQAIFNVISGMVRLVVDLIHGDWSAAWDDVKDIVGDAVRGAAAIIRAQVGLFLAAGKLIANATVDGLEAGLKLLVHAAQEALSKLGAAIKGWVGSAYAYAFSIGTAIVEGILAGLGGLAERIGAKIGEGIHAGVGIAKSVWARAHSPSLLTAEELGVPLVEGIVYGIEGAGDKVGTALGDVLTRTAASAKIRFFNFGTEASLEMVNGIAKGLSELTGYITQLFNDFFDAAWRAAFAQFGQRAAEFARDVGKNTGGGGGGLRIPGLATGGTVLKTGLAVVHEGETYSGVGSSRMPAMAGGGNTYVTVNAPNYVGSNAELARTVRAVLLQEKNRGTRLRFT